MWLEARQGSCLLEASTLRMPSVSLFPWDPKPQCQVRGPSPGWDWSEPGGWAGEWPSPLFAACSSKQPPMCMMFDPFAGASQRPLLIPPTSPPLPSSPPAHQLSLAQYLLHPQITATGRPLCRLCLGDARLGCGNGESHIPPARAWASLGGSGVGVRQHPRAAGMCWGLEEGLGCGKPQVTLLEGSTMNHNTPVSERVRDPKCQLEGGVLRICSHEETDPEWEEVTGPVGDVGL